MKLSGSNKCQGGWIKWSQTLACIPGEEPADVDQTVAMMRDLKSCWVTLDTRMQHVCSRRTRRFSGWGKSASREAVAGFAETTARTALIPTRKLQLVSHSGFVIARRSPIPPVRTNAAYGDSLGSYRRAFKQLRGNSDLDFSTST